MGSNHQNNIELSTFGWFLGDKDMLYSNICPHFCYK